MRKLRVAAVQLRSGIEPAANRAQAMPLLREAATEGARLICTPENTLRLNRDRDAMIAAGLIKEADSRIIWTSDPLPNDAFAVSAALYRDKAFVGRLQRALAETGAALKANPALLPARYTGFVARDNAFYKPIRDAGLATGRLAPK